MKRKSRFIVWVLATAVTFGSLYVIAGPGHFNKHNCHRQQQHCGSKAADSTEKK
jgi:hypothetical protein